MPKSPKKPKTMRNPNIDTTKAPDEVERVPQRRDRGADIEGDNDERELEDQVGRRDDETPDLVPPGTVVDRNDVDTARGETDEGVVADRANARTSDRRDGRDGVDASDTLPADPDAAGGKAPRQGF